MPDKSLTFGTPCTARSLRCIARSVFPPSSSREGGEPSLLARTLRCDARGKQHIEVVDIVFYITTKPKKRRIMKRPASADAAPADMGLASTEEMNEYAERMGRWAADVLEAIHDLRFHTIL